MARSRRARRKAAAEKSSKPPDGSGGAPKANNMSNPNTPSANRGGGWTVHRLADYRQLKAQASGNPYTLSAGSQGTVANGVTGPSPNSNPKTPSTGRHWVKKVGEMTSDKAAKYLRKSKSSPMTPVEVDFMSGYTLLKRPGSIDNVPPLPPLVWKPSREVLTKAERERLEGRSSHPIETSWPKPLPLVGLKNAEEQSASAEQVPREKKSQLALETLNSPEATDLSISTSIGNTKGLHLDYSSSEDADTELPVLSPLKRVTRKKRISSFSRMKETPVVMENKSAAEQDKDKHHLIVKSDPHGKTASPSISKHPSTRIARNSQIQNKNILRSGYVSPSSPPSPTPKARTEKPPLPEDPFSVTYPESAKTLPVKRMSGGRPPIPYRSSKRFASSPGNATRPRHLNNKIASHSPSVKKPQGEASATPESSGTQTPGGNSSKQAKFAHITPRNAGAMSRIPRASPLSLAPATAGTGTPDSSIKSPVYVNRRSSIPIPKRMLQDDAKVSDNGPENDSSVIKEEKLSEESNIKREEDSDDRESDEMKVYEASEVSLSKVEGSDVEQSGDASDKEAGYRVKRLSVTGHGPTLRISASADKVIMGHGLEKGKAPAQKLKANNERRHSWNPRELASLTGSSFSKTSLKSKLSPRPVSSIGSASKKDDLVDGTETKLKKAKSADLLSLTSSRSSPGNGPQKAEIRKVSNKSEHAAHRPSPLREGFDTSTPVSRKSTNTPLKEGTSQSAQSRASRIAARSGRTPSEKSTIKDGKKENTPSTRRVSKPAVGKNETITPSKSTLGKTKSPNATPPGYPPRVSSRKPAPDHTLNAKSKLAHVKNVSSVSNASPKKKPEEISSEDKPEAIEPNGFGLNNDPSPGIKRGSVAAGSLAAGSSKTGTSAAKNSISRGMLSNFKGLFGKPKSGTGIPKSSTSKSLRPKLSSTLTRSKSSKGIKANTKAVGATVTSGTSTRSRFSRGNNRPNTPPMRPLRFPELEFPGNGDVNALTMDILDSAQRETDSSVKLRLIKLGRVLVEAINHSNDAEKSMIQAMQAAKQAEVYSTMTKQNVMQLGLAVQELRNRSSDEVNTEFDPNNVI